MDGKQFDDLIKELGTARLSRAIALRGFLTGVVAAVTGIGLIADSEDADAKKRGKGRQGGHRNDKKRAKGGQEAHADGKGKKRDRKKKGGQKNKGDKKKKKGKNNRSRNVQQQDVACSEPSSVTTDSGNPPLCPGGIRVDSPERTCKIITDPCGCKLEWCVTLGADGEELSFGPVDGQPACTVTRVVVKGGNEGANIYTFDPPALCADGLTTPTDQEISHFDLCGISCCVPETCEDLGVCGENLDDGCNGTIDCPCPTDCPGGGANNTCDNGICVCDPDTCADLPPGVECGTGFDDGCCGAFNCNCPTNCPAGTDDGPNNTCEGGTCVCTKNTCESLGVTCGVHDDGCCGEIDCGPCPEGCTPGYWKNHPGAWVGFSPNALVSSVFNTGSCGSLGSKTLLQALSLKGGSSFCGGVEILLRAAVAALLNAANPGVNYTLTTAQIIAQVNAAIASGVRANVIALAADLDARNNAIGGCPCNNNGCPAS